jgi:methylated-DNA-[protein]-cysteine S-methyltransferase
MIFSIVGSPVGELLLTGDGEILNGLYTCEHVRRPEPAGERDDQAFENARAQLAEYFGGARVEFEVPLDPSGTPFQRQVWRELSRIDYGTTVSYRELAERIGNPAAVRAVGLANGRNPISIIVPCHRVVGSNGALTGYAGGLPLKEWLLDHETEHRPTRAA